MTCQIPRQQGCVVSSGNSLQSSRSSKVLSNSLQPGSPLTTVCQGPLLFCFGPSVCPFFSTHFPLSSPFPFAFPFYSLFISQPSAIEMSVLNRQGWSKCLLGLFNKINDTAPVCFPKCSPLRQGTKETLCLEGSYSHLTLNLYSLRGED